MCTKIFCWNVRGFNIFSHRSGFKKWFKDRQPIFGGLIETHVKQPNEKKFINDLFSGWYFEENYGFSSLGKIWVLWHPSVKVVVVTKSLQMITCEVFLPDSDDWIIISVVYASNEKSARKELWKELVMLAFDQRVADKHWLVLGDFNQVLNPNEHSKNTNLNVNRRIREFRECLLDAELFDLVYKGNNFTWWNKSKTKPVVKKLDMILVNDSWCALFPTYFASFGEPNFSDHVACEVIFSTGEPRAKKPFKFYHFLL